jgi:chromosome segregation ATPase
MNDEIKSYKDQLENLGTEKLALDRQYVKKLQECVQLEANCIKYEIEIGKLKVEIQSLKTTNESLQNQLNAIKEGQERMSEIGD